MPKPLQRGRLAFAASCLNLAKQELKDHGREFMNPGEDVYDSAVQYGGKINLTRAEIIEAERLAEESEGEHL
jgi:hypothetical protein